DVPYIQHFHEGYALHGAFWHDEFGHPRSHGCINLAPADAAWLFEWTDPVVPPDWHGPSTPRAAPSSGRTDDRSLTSGCRIEALCFESHEAHRSDLGHPPLRGGAHGRPVDALPTGPVRSRQGSRRHARRAA